jgi:hypothetical protein
MKIAGLVGITDEELIVRAMRDAQSLLAEHIERGPYDAEQAITELLEVIDRPDIVAATSRVLRSILKIYEPQTKALLEESLVGL